MRVICPAATEFLVSPARYISFYPDMGRPVNGRYFINRSKLREHCHTKKTHKISTDYFRRLPTGHCSAVDKPVVVRPMSAFCDLHLCVNSSCDSSVSAQQNTGRFMPDRCPLFVIRTRAPRRAVPARPPLSRPQAGSCATEVRFA
jgi:hypothetical protein